MASPSAWPLLFPPIRVAASSIALKLGGGQRNRMRAGRPRSQEMPSRRSRWGSFEEKQPGSLMKTNHQWTRINTNRPEDRWTGLQRQVGAKMLLQYCTLGVTRSWDDGFLGARASRPHQAWHQPSAISAHLDQPATAPWLSFGLADAVPADRVAACSIALKLGGGQRNRMRAVDARAPRRCRPERCGEGVCRRDGFSENRRAPFGKLPFAHDRVTAPAPHDGADHSRVKQVVVSGKSISPRAYPCGSIRVVKQRNLQGL